MQSVLKIFNLNSKSDITRIKNALSNVDGILAVEFRMEVKSINVVYDGIHINLDGISDILEESGYFCI